MKDRPPEETLGSDAAKIAGKPPLRSQAPRTEAQKRAATTAREFSARAVLTMLEEQQVLKDALTSRQTAALTGYSVSTLSKKRIYGGGPRFIRLSSKRVVYRRLDVELWLRERECAASAGQD